MEFRRRAGLAALVIAAASISPAMAQGAAGDECGTIGTPPAGDVVVAAGTIVCADAMAVVNRYLTDLPVAADGEWVRFDGWECWTPSADQAMMNGFGTECSRGMDNVQIRR